MGFCTVNDLETFLQITVPDDKLAAAERAIDEATAAIRNYCRQTLTYVADDEVTLDCGGGTKIVLPELPVVEVTEVIEDDETLVVDDDYKLGQHGILHRIGATWAKGIQIIEVTYSHGYYLDEDYVDDTLPQEIVDVCTRAAARAYQAGLRAEEVEGVPGVQATSLGDYSVTFGSEQSGGAGEAVLGASASPMLLRSEKEMLSKYRV